MLGNTLCWGQRGDFEPLGVVNYPTELHMFYSTHYLKPSERQIENYILYSVCSERPDNLAGENSEMHWKWAGQGNAWECIQCEADVNVNGELWMGSSPLRQQKDLGWLGWQRIYQDTFKNSKLLRILESLAQRLEYIKIRMSWENLEIILADAVKRQKC